MRLAQEGARVVLSDVMEDALQATAEEFRSKGYTILAKKANVTEAAEVTELVDAAVSEFGSLDILVNNAGITRDNLLLRMKEEDWDLVLKINLKGAFLCTKMALRPLMKSAGCIVNIASVIGIMGNAGQANYSASKAGLIGLTKSTAKELSSRGVRVNAVAPGYIDTEMTRALPDNVREAILKNIPLARMGTPEDVANVVCFLAGDAAAYVTGQVIPVDGGMVM
ncbi:MAG TPA: 3-oxoacyl-[acyl-carrier-protein] reductase [bacterium]|nr:3-oxoacyl-[acyl-carrier-protein] reductase [bacterium]